jgi:integral membrane sensor domain MASE1
MAMDADCAKRMMVWCCLVVVLVSVFLAIGYALFEAPVQTQRIQLHQRSPVVRDK